MDWFSFLKLEGYFDPKKNPDPVQVKDGVQVPYWESLSYLDKLSEQISQGSNVELVDELLNVIKDVSEHPKDNNRTWYLFIKFLGKLPNEKIPIEILDYIPVWLSGKFDTMLQTSELCDNLLPKFLNDEPTKEDVEKAELILHYLFQVDKEKIKQDDVWTDKVEELNSKVYLHFLSSKFEKGGIIPKVVKYCSTNFVLELGRTVKFLLLDYSKGIIASLKDKNLEYEIRIFVEKKNLLVYSTQKGNDAPNDPLTLRNWEGRSKNDLKKEIVSLLKQQNINYTPTNDSGDILQRLDFALNTDLTSAFGINSIRKLNDQYSNNEKALNVFSSIFRDLLDETVKQKKKEAIPLLKIFCFDTKYYIPFYKRIVLYVICENWSVSKPLFWKLLGDNDPLHLFSSYKYQKELYDLLHRNQQSLLKKEKSVLQIIIDNGYQSDSNEVGEKDNDYWQLRWYSALKDILPFNEKYLSLSNSLNISNEHYENLGEVRSRSGSISPITNKDLLEKSNEEIAKYIKSFKPTDYWEDPNITGLSDLLGRVVESHPERFSNGIEWFDDIAYIYSYRMINAFSEAWKKQKQLNWEKVLHYCLDTLNNPKFSSGDLKVENDIWNANADWVVGSIAELISAGLKKDKNAYDEKLLPLTKEIIKSIVSNLKSTDDFSATEMDHPTYSLNSTQGKSLRALLDYSLYVARNNFKSDEKEKWDAEMKLLFEETLEKGIIDGYIIEGMYFEQFMFLDKDWIVKQVKGHYDCDEKQWHAFMGSFVFANPPFNKELYTLFYPHYEKAIEKNNNLKGIHDLGVVRHLTAFYFWKFESIASEKLLFKFINSATPGEVNKLINFIWQQQDYQKNLSGIALHEFQQIILEIWNYLVTKYDQFTNKTEQDNLAALVKWVIFVPELNSTYSNLLLKSCKHISEMHLSHELLENLVLLKKKGDPDTVAKSISKILPLLDYDGHIADFDKDFIEELTLFLFAHNQKHFATEFCNNMASVHQQFFLRNIYEENVKK